MSPFLPSQNQGVWARCTTSMQQTLTPGLQVQMHPIPEASVVHQERGCPLYRPSQPTIQVVGDGPVQSPMEHLTPKAHHSLRAVNNGWEAKQDKRFILGVQHHMDETSKKLLDLFLCKRKGSSSHQNYHEGNQ